MASFVSSYIPTAGAAVTRAADVASMTGTNFSSWYRQDEGTFVVSGYSPTPPSGTIEVLLDVGAGGAFGTTAYISRIIGGYSAAPSAAPVNLNIWGTTNTPAYNIALALKANDSAMSTMSAAAVADTTCNMPASATTLTIGKAGWAASAHHLNGHISRLAFYPKRLSNSELQALSTI